MNISYETLCFWLITVAVESQDKTFMVDYRSNKNLQISLERKIPINKKFSKGLEKLLQVCFQLRFA